jgi:hypothetical protein
MTDARWAVAKTTCVSLNMDRNRSTLSMPF